VQKLPVNKYAVVVVILLGVGAVEWAIHRALGEPPPAPLFVTQGAGDGGSPRPGAPVARGGGDDDRARGPATGPATRGATTREDRLVDTARKLAHATAALATASGNTPVPPDGDSPPPEDTGPAPALSGGGAPRSPEPTATLDKESIQDAVRSVIPAVRHCYQSGLKLKGDSQGAVKVSFTLVAADGGGFMRDAEIVESDLANPLIDACVLESLSTAQFPMPRGEGVVRVTYPFRFSF
jgi:hypothetical protein